MNDETRTPETPEEQNREENATPQPEMTEGGVTTENQAAPVEGSAATTPDEAAEGGQPESLEWEQVGEPKTSRLRRFFGGIPPFWKSAWFMIAVLAVLLAIFIVSIAPEPVRYLELDVKASVGEDFGETGEVFVAGIDTLSAEELKSAIRFTPESDFTVAIADSPRRAILTLTHPRNIAYGFEFRMTVEAPPPEGVAGQAGPFTKQVFVTEELNGPPMAVTVARGTGTGINPLSPLTLRFSEQVDIDSLEENLSISPRTRYTLGYDAFNVFITPEESWRSGGNYTLSIGAGYKSKNGRQFQENESLSFKVLSDGSESPMVDYVSDRSYILNSARDISLVFHGQKLMKNVPVVAETYRIPTMEKFREQGSIYLDYDVPLDHLEKVDSNVYLVRNGEQQFSMAHPGEGAYIVAVNYTSPLTGEPVQERSSYLITPYTVYMQASARDTLVWLNRAGEGAMAGYALYYGDSEEPAGVTGEDGTLLTDNSKVTTEGFSIYDPDGALVYYDNGVLQNGDHQERYYSYLFTDRTLYRPEDTVSFWGFARPFRNNRLETPSTVTVTFDPGGLNLERELPISPEGVFSGEIPLERIKSSQYEISASLSFPSAVEGEPGTTHTLDSLYLSVQEYTKPSYVLSSVVDKGYYGHDDQVRVTVSASFYDGTPLPRFPIEASHFQSDSDWSATEIVETDDLGNATFTFPAWEGGGNGAALTSNRYMARIASDGENVTHVGSYRVFPSDVLMETAMARDTDGNNLGMTIRAYALDLESQALANELAALEEDPYGYYRFDNDRLLEIARGAPVDVEDLTVSLRWDYYDTRNIRHRYIYEQYGTQILFSNSYSLDYMTRYNPGVRVLDDPNTGEKLVQLSTVNGVATLEDLIYLEEGESVNFARDAYCRAYLTYSDGAGNSCGSYAYYPGYDSYREDWSEEENEPVPGYVLAARNVTTGEDVTPDYGLYYYNEITMNVGETINFSLLLDSMPVPAENSRILYSLIQDGVMERHIAEGDSFDFTYRLEYGTSLKLVAVCYDGTGTRRVRQLDIYATAESLGLTVDVTPDRESYRPGEPVSLAVRATDRNGNGVAGNLCVAVVDESIFALSEQYINVFDGLYGDVRYLNNYVSQYFTTYRDEPEPPMDGGKGDGGGVEFYDSYRSNFKDTALFLPVTLSGAGTANLSFDLPDNTTSWRITTVAVGENLLAGQSKSNIISTLPFFTKPVLTAKYVEGDELAMLVQGHGVLLDAESEISYSVTLTGDGISETITAEGLAYEPQEINFGKLPVGSYTVVSTSTYSGYSDTVELPVNVLRSNLELVVNRPLDLSAPIDIEAMRYPVTLTFYDREAQPFITSISSLFGHYCMQISQRLSRVVAKQAIRYTMPGEEPPVYIAETSENISDLQNEDGGISEYPDYPSDPLLTAYVLLTSPGQFNEQRMASFFHERRQGDDDPKIAAACDLGLAALGESNVPELTAMLERETTLDVKAYYIAALALSGERDAAEAFYEELCAPHVAKMDNYREDDYTASAIAWERDAAACWVAASILGHPDADALALHFGDYRWRYRTLYECMIYVSTYERVLAPASLSYSVLGQQRDVTLGVDAITPLGYYNGLSALMHTVVLNRSELDSFRLISASENVSATAYYVGEPAEIGINQSDSMKVEKAIEPLGNNNYEVTVKIWLGENAPTGHYDMSDWIPSNSRLYSMSQDAVITGANGSRRTEPYFFSTRQENQNLYVSFATEKKEEQTIEFRYVITKTYNSEAALDTVYLINGYTGDNCNSEKSFWRG